jgi:hypothetical protein
MKKLLTLLFFVSLCAMSFSQVSKDNSYYQSKDGSLYFVDENIIVGQPSSNHTFSFIRNPEGRLPVSGDTIVIKGFYMRGDIIFAYGAVGKVRFNIVFETAIETGELLSHDALQKRNSKKNKR